MPNLKLVPATKPTRRAVKPATPVGVVSQVRHALRRDNLLATACGSVLGGFVPGATFAVAHGEITHASPLYTQPLAALVLAGLLFSAITVASWGRMAFGNWYKACGFTVLIEGVMTCSSQAWLAYVALGLLVGINAIATGVTLSKQR